MKEQILCPYCLSTKVIKKGLNTTKKKQRFKCCNCKKHIVTDGHKWFVTEYDKEILSRLLGEKLSLRGICRVLKLSLSWLMIYINKIYNKLPDDLNFKPIINKKNSLNNISLKLIENEVEADEMWSFVKNKKWIWIALDVETRQVICFHVGNRGRKDAKLFWSKVPEKMKKESIFHTDDWKAYKGVIPQEIHHFTQYKKYTNHIERFNNTVRQRVSRLVRLALSFSKKLENHIGAIKYFFCLHNKEQQLKLGINL